MSGVADLLRSERGAFALLALVAATLLTVVGKLDGAAWLDFVKYLTGVLVASKTVTTAVETITTKKPQIQREPEIPPARTVQP